MWNSVERQCISLCLALALSLGLQACNDDLGNLVDSGSTTTVIVPTTTGTSSAPITFSGIHDGAGTTHDQIKVRFPPATGGAGSFVYRAYLNGNFLAVAASGTGGNPDADGKLSLVIPSLNIGSTYNILIRAWDGAQEDKNTKTLNLSTLAYRVPAFNGLTSAAPKAGILGRTTLSLSWDPAVAPLNEAILSYQIYKRVSGASYDFSAPALVVPSTTTAVDLSGLTQGTTYGLIVRARSSSGFEDSNINEKVVTTNSPAAITFAGASSAAASTGANAFNEAYVYWAPASGDFDHYKVYISTTAPGTSPTDAFWTTPVTQIFSTGQSSYKFTGLLPRTTYYVGVRAALSSPAAADTNVSVKTVYTEPSLPIFGGATGISQPAGIAGLTSLKIQWSPASGTFNRYYIFQKSGGGTYNFSSPIAMTSPPNTDYTITGLTTGTQACFIVRAVYDGVSPVYSESNLVEVCGTPQYTPPSFAGVATCTAASSNGSTTLTLGWGAASGIYDQYRVWVTSGSLDFNAAPTMTISPSLTSQSAFNLTPGTTYNVAVRARYSSNGIDDGNTVIRTCTTDAANLVLTKVSNGIKLDSLRLANETQVCIQDNLGNNIQTYNPAVTISLAAGNPANFGGTLTRTPVQGCATFSDLTYSSSGTIQMRFSATGLASIDSPNIVVQNPPVAPTGACKTDNVDWTTAYGGCYSSAIGLVVGSMHNGDLPLYQAGWIGKADLSDVDLHDWQVLPSTQGTTISGTARPMDMDPAATMWPSAAIGSGVGSCHSLVEGGYTDWRLPTNAEFLAIRNVAGWSTQLSFGNNWGGYNGYSNWFWTSSSDANNYLIFHLGAGYNSNSNYWDNRSYFCVRNPENTFSMPVTPTGLAATTASAPSGATVINLSWAAPASGSYSGYYLYVSPQGTPINYSAAPYAKIKRGSTAYTVTGLSPNTTYQFSLRSVYTNRSPELSDGNTATVTATTLGAHLELTLFSSQPLSSGKLAIVGRVLEDTTNLPINASIPLTLSKASGNADISGTLTVNTASGIAIFQDVSVTDTSGSGTIQVSLSATNLTTVTSALKTITPVYTSTCNTFTYGSEIIYPDHGGCYFKTRGLVVSARAGWSREWYAVVWESGPSPGFANKETSDTLDGDGDGQYDDIDSTSYTAYTTGIPSTGGVCHNLDQGGKTDWVVPRMSELYALNSAVAWNYTSAVVYNYQYWSSRRGSYNTDVSYGDEFQMGSLTPERTGWLGDWAGGSPSNGGIICIRRVP